MSKRKKLVAKLRDKSQNNSWTFSDLRTLLAYAGWELRRVSGSHHQFRKENVQDGLALQPDKGKAKDYQVDQVRKPLISDGSLEAIEGEQDNPETSAKSKKSSK